MERSKEETSDIASVKSSLIEAQKQAKAYQEAHEALQTELETNEKAIDQLKQQLQQQQNSADASKKSSSTNPNGIEPETLSILGTGAGSGTSIETSYLLDQVEALRGAVKFLRNENAHLKSADALRELDSLPALNFFGSNQDEEEEKSIKLEGLPIEARKHLTKGETLRLAADESKLLYSQLIKFASCPKVVDLSLQNKAPPNRNQESGSKTVNATPSIENQSSTATTTTTTTSSARKPWVPRSRLPESQYKAQKALEREVSRRVQLLAERVRSVNSSTASSKRFGNFKMPTVTSLSA